jgi:alginate O-acetyltransferase complex protein AlgI
MLLGGLWHGAGWTFVFWGGLHGVYLSINHWWRKQTISMPKLLAWMITFLAVVASWVLFRAHNIHDGMEILQTMAGIKGIVLPGEPQGKLSWLIPFGVQLKGWQELTYLPLGSKESLVILAGLTLGVALLPNTQQILQRFKPTLWWAVCLGAMAAFCLLSLNRVSEFLYFQF